MKIEGSYTRDSLLVVIFFCMPVVVPLKQLRAYVVIYFGVYLVLAWSYFTWYVVSFYVVRFCSLYVWFGRMFILKLCSQVMLVSLNVLFM